MQTNNNYANAKTWDESGSVGDKYYSPQEDAFFTLMKDGNPSTNNIPFPEGLQSDGNWTFNGRLTSENWLQFVDDSLQINQISLPGTHDTGTYTVSKFALTSRWVKTQDDSISQQLKDGIRFLDIRCRHINNSFAIHHDRFYLNLNFTEVLEDCYSFLEKNPHEFILMSVKNEYTEKDCTRSFNDTFLTDYLDPKKWFTENRFPRLEEARGKIVLFRRFSGTNGIDASTWPDNQTFETDGRLHVQDEYEQRNEVLKGRAIKAAWDFAITNSDKGWLTLNFTSIAADTFTSTRQYAQDKNPELSAYINGVKGHGGVVISDFPRIGDITKKVISTNFRNEIAI